MSNIGRLVGIHYRSFLEDGTPLNDSRTAGVPIEFVCGVDPMIPAFDEAVADMAVGQRRTLRVPAQRAYGLRRDDLVMRRDASQVPDFDSVRVGDWLSLGTPTGQPLPARVVARDEEGVVVDANHWLAGCDLLFEIELLFARDPQAR